MKLARRAGATSQIFQIFIRDSTSTTGAGLTGLTNASAGLSAYFHRDTDSTATAISLVSMTAGTFTSSGFVEIDSTHMPGWYQFCPPNTALATGASSAAIHLKGATNMVPLPIEVDLDTQVDVYNWQGHAVSVDGSNYPNVGVFDWAGHAVTVDANNVPQIAVLDWNGVAVGALPTHFSSLAIDAGGLVTYNNTAPPTTGSIAAAVMTDTTDTIGAAVVAINGHISGNVCLAGSAPSWYAAPSSPTSGAVVVGSTASAVIVSGLPSGMNYAGQKLYHLGTGEVRTIASQTYGSPNYTLTLGVGTGESGPFSATPTTGDTVIPVP